MVLLVILFYYLEYLRIDSSLFDYEEKFKGELMGLFFFVIFINVLIKSLEVFIRLVRLEK